MPSLRQIARRLDPRREAATAPPEPAAICTDPAALYEASARQTIASLLEPWLARQPATAFELLHRADLATKLDASGAELQHAIQKVAVATALARKLSVHEVVRQLQRLTDRALGRLQTDQRQGAFPLVEAATFAELCTKLAQEPRGVYRLSGGLARHLASAETWTAKLDRLLDLFDAAPNEGPGRALALAALEPPVTDLVSAKASLSELIGEELDLGAELIALMRLAHGEAVRAVLQVQPALAAACPPATEAGRRLAAALETGEFADTRLALSRRVLQEFKSRRRLRPDSPAGELQAFRTLAIALTAAGGAFLPAEEVRAAVVERSKMLVQAEFLGGLLVEAGAPLASFAALVNVLETVAGDVNRRRALGWLSSHLAARRLEDEAVADAGGAEPALVELARLYHRIARAGARLRAADELLATLGEIGGRIETAHRVTQAFAGGLMPRERKLDLLGRMASGETAPPGPAASQAAATLRRFSAA